MLFESRPFSNAILWCLWKHTRVYKCIVMYFMLNKKFLSPKSHMVVCYKKTPLILLKQDHISRGHITMSNSKATWVRWDVKPNWRKLLLYLGFTKVPSSFIRIARHAWFSIQSVSVVWGIITIFKHSYDIKGWRDMALWPTCPIARLSPVALTLHFICRIPTSQIVF